ncbi:MAG: aldolase/citrate lyase family protein [Candidatus Bathyarchaeota archaeon]
MRNNVKETLEEGGVALGAWISVLDPVTARVVAGSGLDWVLFDTEHGPSGIETIDGLVRGVIGAGASPLIRVVWNDINAIKKALDTGVYGIVVPWVNTKEEAEKAVSYTRYAPEGLRGCAAGRPASAWGMTGKEYMDIVNDQIFVAVQIETKKAVDNIDEIVSAEGVDATFVGPSDLSASYGVRGQFWHPKVRGALETIIEASEAAGVAPGIAFGKGPEHCVELIEQGFRFIGVGGDTAFLRRGCEATLAKIQG